MPSTMHLPLRSPLLREASFGSSSEDYRSVIDDLTIENQQLKSRLEASERRQAAHAHKDELFEVKIYGLSSRKRRELEQTLRKFAASLDATSTPGMDQPTKRSGLVPTALKSSSSMMSTRFADSGYGSMAASNLTSGRTSGQAQRRYAETSRSRVQNIKTYLHDIPEGLLPQRPVQMTEKSKQRLVVQRLEQIFGGSGAVPGPHQQSMQQQEVSRLAARDERSTLEAQGRTNATEGTREARIMDTETEDPMEPSTMMKSSSEALTDQLASDKVQYSTHLVSSSGGSSPEQRPTRPLDLDPDRAQDSADNLRYFHHLGFDSSAADTVDDKQWIYLNLLMSTAQLHVHNVTADFVRQAICERSKSLELSKDGRKIRWLDNGRNVSVSGTPRSASIEPASMESKASPQKRRYSQEPVSDDYPCKRQRVATPSNTQPMTDTGTYADESVDSYRASKSASIEGLRPSVMCEQDGHSVNETKSSKGTRMTTSRKQGALMFYNSGAFCTDLSGDASGRKHRSSRYVPLAMEPLGTDFHHLTSTSHVASGELDDNAFAALSKPPSNDATKDSRALNLDFPSDRRSPKHVTFAEPEEPMPLKVSGIGGVTPSDNMSITVLRRRTMKPPQSTSTLNAAASRNSKLSSVLSNLRPPSPRVSERIIAAHRHSIDPSPLPPASMHFAAVDGYDSDSSSEVSSADSQRSTTSTKILRQRYATMMPTLPAVSLSAASDTSSSSIYSSASNSDVASMEETPDIESDATDSGYDDDSDEDDDQSIDFLASARVADPEAVRAKEREYDAQMAERLAETIPAGSSAATAGGGSGYASSSEEEMDEDDDGEGSVGS